MKQSLTLIGVLLGLNLFGQPANDNCEDAIAIAAGLGLTFNSVSGTTDGPEHPNSACFSFGTDFVHNDIWYSYEASTTGYMEWSTCNNANFDTRLAVYNAGAVCPVDDLDLLACNDDGIACSLFTSSLIFEVVAGEIYLLRLGGYVEGDFGEGTFDLVSIADPIFSAHSDCSDNDFVAVVTQEQADNGEGWTYGDNLYAPALDGVDPPTCLPQGEFYDVWFSFNNGMNDTIIFNFESFTDSADYQMEIFSECGTVAPTQIDGGEILIGCYSLPSGFVGEQSIVGFENPSNYIIRISTTVTNDFPGEFRFQLIGQDEAVSIEEINESSFSFYPNPATETLSIQSELNNVRINIYAVNGSLIASDLVSGISQMNISSLESGIYIIEMKKDELSLRDKLIIQ